MTFKVICRKEIIYKNSTSPLCLLFFQGKRKKAVGLGVSVALKHWDAEAQKVTDDCPDRDNIQAIELFCWRISETDQRTAGNARQIRLGIQTPFPTLPPV